MSDYIVETPRAWTRIPKPIEKDTDRRELAAILAANDLEVRVVKVKLTPNGTPRRYIEFREVAT